MSIGATIPAKLNELALIVSKCCIQSDLLDVRTRQVEVYCNKQATEFGDNHNSTCL